MQAPKTNPEPRGAAAPGQVTRQWLRLSVGDAACAVPIDRVREILQVGRMTSLPRVPSAFRGVMNLRGAVVPVIDLGARLSGGGIVVGRRTCIIVVELPATDEQPALLAGVMVDAVFEVVDVDAASISEVPTLGTDIAPEFLEGVLQLQGRMLHLLRIERVLSQSELTDMVTAHAA